MMKGKSDTNLFISRKMIRENLNWAQNARRWSVVAPLHVFFFWILTKGKIRYILGAYTILLTLSLHYSTQNTSYIVSDLYLKGPPKTSQEQEKSQLKCSHDNFECVQKAFQILPIGACPTRRNKP